MKNIDGQLCNSYPNLIVIPNKLTPQTLVKGLDFRTKKRIPVMTYYFNHQTNKSCGLWRSSQSKVFNIFLLNIFI